MNVPISPLTLINGKSIAENVSSNFFEGENFYIRELFSCFIELEVKLPSVFNQYFMHGKVMKYLLKIV